MAGMACSHSECILPTSLSRVDQTVEWSAMTKLRGPDIKTSECVAYGQAQPPSTDRAEDTTYEVIGNGN